MLLPTLHFNELLVILFRFDVPSPDCSYLFMSPSKTRIHSYARNFDPGPLIPPLLLQTLAVRHSLSLL